MSSPAQPSGTTTVVTSSQAKHDIHKFRSVTHLTDENWVTHKFKQIAALAERGLEEVANRNEKEPDKKADPQSWHHWKDKDVSAQAQIIQNLSKEVQPLVYDTNTATEAWQALKDEFESKNLDKVANIRHIYDTLVYIEGTPMRDHINKLKILRERLGAMGDEIKDTSHAMRMLRHLPPSWDGVCQVLCAMQLTVQKVRDRLLAEEEARKTAMSYANSGTATALAAALKDPHAVMNLQALVTTQFSLMLLNSNPNKVPSLNPRSKGKSQTKLKNLDLQCTNPNCLKKGHTMARCWATGGGQEGKGPKSRKTNETQTNHVQNPSNPMEAKLAEIPEISEIMDVSTEDSAWIANILDQTLKQTSINDWILDSGATTHVSPNKNLFNSYNQFSNPRSIGMADHSSLLAFRIGNIWVKLNLKGKVSNLKLTNMLFAPNAW